MKSTLLPEPELEFGNGKHIDVKFGLMNYGPLDFDHPLAPKVIKLGIVGTSEAIEGVIRWIEKIRLGIDAKPSKRPNLFPRFPGFGDGHILQTDFLTDSQLMRPIPSKAFEMLCAKPRTNEVIKEIASLFLEELEYLVQKTSADILVCAFPQILVDFIDKQVEFKFNQEDDIGGQAKPVDNTDSTNYVLHDYLKAQSMRFRKPTQIIRPSTYELSAKSKRKGSSRQSKSLQDEATRAWNIYTACYYKTGGTPWRLVRNSSQLSACYIGLSFFRTLDETRLLTSTAQIFNERGEGIILRGGTAKLSKDDKQIHMSSEDAYNLLKNALDVYRREHKNFPARIVVHKSSMHNQDEISGFEEALRGFSIQPEQADLLSITQSSTRLLRANIYPPLRGTLLETGGREIILYTKGSVGFFSTYPGMYIPRPLAFRCDLNAETPLFLASEILSLTKMNWNNTQFDGEEPITLHASRQVGSILKYLESTDKYEPYYRFYM